jgi:capsular exopolysaccharide synthesis family protein
MSQIKKALERAKAERLFPDILGASAPIPTPPEKGADRTDCDGSPSCLPDEVVFTDTRVFEASAEEHLRNRLVAINEDGAAAEQFKHLRTQIFHRTRPNGWNVIQVTSFGIGEGKSTVAANLAISIAKDTRNTTLLVDLDFRRPSLARLLGLGEECIGLKSYFLDDTPLEALFVSPGIRKLAVLPAGGKVTHAAELLGSPKMETLIRELKNRYPDRCIIIDTPAINACPDPLIISEYVDAVILVARIGHTTQESIKAAVERIPKDKVLGIIMNEMESIGTCYC